MPVSVCVRFVSVLAAGAGEVLLHNLLEKGMCGRVRASASVCVLARKKQEHAGAFVQVEYGSGCSRARKTRNKPRRRKRRVNDGTGEKGREGVCLCATVRVWVVCTIIPQERRREEKEKMRAVRSERSEMSERKTRGRTRRKHNWRE